MLVEPSEGSIVGRGQFGKVWRAQSRKTGCNYAVKNVSRQRMWEGSDHVAQREKDLGGAGHGATVTVIYCSWYCLYSIPYILCILYSYTWIY